MHAQFVGAREAPSAAAAGEGPLPRVGQLVPGQVGRALEPATLHTHCFKHFHVGELCFGTMESGRKSSKKPASSNANVVSPLRIVSVGPTLP